MNIFTRICSLAIAGILFAFSGHAQQTYYVRANATGSNNGTSWLHAFTDLQSALDVAANGDQIWVAAGTYKPSKDQTGSTTPTDVRKKVFILSSGIKLYGGFAGTESSIAQRNIALNLTILSGDRLGNDEDAFVNTSDNCYHVVAVNAPDSPTVLDGVTIKGGNSDNGTYEDLFLGQNFGYLFGGGIYTLDGTNFTLSNSIVRDNKAYHGGGMFNRRTPPVVFNCVFTNNKATSYGGAIHFEYPTSAPAISNTVMTNNAAEFGSAIFNRGAQTTIVGSTIVNNSVATNGGTIYNENPSSPTIRNSIIYKNSGGVPVVNEGGATATITYTNIEVGYVGTGNINTDPIFQKFSDPDGPDNLWRTSDDGLHLRVISTSADAGNNDYTGSVTTDITGAARIQNTTVAMGAYETVQPVYTIYVNKYATGSNNGTSWTNAFTSLQSALETAENGDQIWVAAGIYLPSKDDAGNATPANPRKKAFILKNGVKLYGGFLGFETSLAQRNTRGNQTILSGDLNGDDQANFANMGDNCYHVVGVDHPDSPTVLDGVTVKGGNANNGAFEDLFLGEYFGYTYGGGVFSVYGSDFTLSNSTLSGNNGYHGGGLLARGTPAKVINCVFSGNKSARAGGGIFFENPSAVPVVTNSVFENNYAPEFGGAIYNRKSNTLMVNNTIVNNKAETNGSAIYNEAPSSPSVQNTIIWGNTGTSIIYSEGGAGATISYSLIQGGYTGTGNINQTPSFASIGGPAGLDNVWGTQDDGLALLKGSPAAETGLNAAIIAGITTDVVGDARIQGDKVNMGAYERVKQTVNISITTSPVAYDGNPHYVTISTFPVGVSHTVTYKKGGSTQTPIDAGDYEVQVVITDPNYIGYGIGSLTISKADQTITVTAPPATYVGDVVTIQASTTSGLPLTFSSSDTDVAVTNGNLVTFLQAGTVTITVTQTGNDNYNSASQQIALDVIRKTQTITLVEPETTYVGDVFEIEASTTSGLELTFWTSNEAVATIEGSTVTLVGEGEVTITANQPGNAEYYENYVEMTLTVTKEPQTITFAPLTERILGEEPFELAATTTSGLPITYTSSNLSVATIEGNIVTLVGGGETIISAYQEGNERFAAAPVVEQHLEVILVASAENPNGKGLKVYPNPAKNIITIEGHDARMANTVALSDSNGRNLNAKCVTISNGMQLDLSHLPAGIYYLKAMTRDGVTVTKVIKN